ncbi:MAG: hypothetical protein ACI9F2_000186 [Lysobacterales bacterium]|jgi:hypothetical protein
MKKQTAILLMSVCVTQQGCLGALINAPFQILGNTLKLVGQLFKVAQSLPVPPGLIPGL